MPSNLDWKKLLAGQSQIGEVVSRGSHRESLVQVIPIRSARTGKVKRMSVQSKKNGRGTVAR